MVKAISGDSAAKSRMAMAIAAIPVALPRAVSVGCYICRAFMTLVQIK